MVYGIKILNAYTIINISAKPQINTTFKFLISNTLGFKLATLRTSQEENKSLLEVTVNMARPPIKLLTFDWTEKKIHQFSCLTNYIFIYTFTISDRLLTWELIDSGPLSIQYYIFTFLIVDKSPRLDLYVLFIYFLNQETLLLLKWRLYKEPCYCWIKLMLHKIIMNTYL